MKDWIPHRQQFLYELYRHDGLGIDATSPPLCACAKDHATTVQSANKSAGYRCMECMPSSLMCSACIVRAHDANPLHRLEVSIEVLNLHIHSKHLLAPLLALEWTVLCSRGSLFPRPACLYRTVW